MIAPTVGRVVWYWPGASDLARPRFSYPDNSQPLAATVACVHNDRKVNIAFVDQSGAPWHRTDVRLLQEGDDTEQLDGCAQWMPYQQAQQRKQL